MTTDALKFWNKINYKHILPVKHLKWLLHYYNYITIISVLFILAISISIYIYRACSKEFYRHATTNAQTIDLTLNDIFNETSLVANYISSQIAQTNTQDLDKIQNIISSNSRLIPDSQPIYSWTLFDWVSPEGKLLVNSKIGILDPPIDYHFETLELCKLYPNTLQLAAPSIGNPSGMWVIPAGMGVINKSDEYLGLLSLGLNIAYINKLISKHLPDPNASFIVLTEDYRVVFQSSNNEVDPKTSYYKEFLNRESFSFQSSGRLVTDLHYKGIVYSHYRTMKSLPYIILTGTESSVIMGEFQSRIFIRLIEIVVIGFFFILLLHLSRKSLLNKTQSAYAVREHFSHRLNLEMQGFVASILGICDVLLRYYKGDIDIGISQEKKMKLIADIQQAALNLNSVTTNVLNLTFVDVNSIIRESTTMLSQLALMKKTKIRLKLENCLKPLYADEIRFRQIIVIILSLLLEYNPNHCVIKVRSLRRTFRGRHYLIIQIQDNGFNLSIEDMRRISERFDLKTADPSGLNPEFSVAERLIDLHNGRYYFINRVQGHRTGKQFNLVFPYSPPQAFQNPSHSHDEKNNVIDLHKPKHTKN